MTVVLPSARSARADAASSTAGRATETTAIGLVGTYPPTKCGIATFTASLAGALEACDSAVGIVRCVERPSAAATPPEVVAELVRGSHASRAAAARALDRFDAVVLQHEFGIYGGADGAEVLDLVSRSGAPLVVVLHTVLEQPSWRQRRIFERLVDRADVVVAQSLAASRRLTSSYDVDPQRVEVIPHGARSNLGSWDPAVRHAPTVITWGLIGPGKGIELGIEAMARLDAMSPRPRYLVLGQTHPNLVAAQGEAYREQLVELARTLGVGDRVEFDDRYHDTVSLLRRIHEADVVLLPYRSREQVVSGVLVEAIASGKPVVATAFPHAVEVLADGSGVVVPHDDAEAIAAGLRALLTDSAQARLARAAARRQAPTLSWENVADSYRRLTTALVSGGSRATG